MRYRFDSLSFLSLKLIYSVMKNFAIAENYKMIKTILIVALLLFSNLLSLYASTADRSGAEYLEGYLNYGLDSDVYDCTLQSAETYICIAKNLKEGNDTVSLEIGEMRLIFDRKRVEPILDEAVAHTYFKSMEISETIKKRLEGMHFENGMQRAVQKSRLEKMYLYDPSVKKRVYGLLFESMKEGAAKELGFHDKEWNNSISIALLRYRNDLRESEGVYLFPKRILGALSLSLKGMHIKSVTGRDLDADRSAAVWEGLRSLTPPEIPMVTKKDLDYFLKKSSIFSDESRGDALFNLKNSALDADTLLCVGRMELYEPERSKNSTLLKMRIENVRSLLNDAADAGTGDADATLLEFATSTKLSSQNMQRYRAELKKDPDFKKSTESVAEYISAVASFYRKRCPDRRFETFVDSMEHSINSFLRGESDTVSFRLRNRSGLSFRALAGELFSRMMQKQKESYPNQNIVEFLFDNFSMEFGNGYR